MAKIWKEALDLKVHRDFMRGAGDGGCDIDPETSDGWVYFVRECSFTFHFATRTQIRIALEYFSRSTHPSSRLPDVTLEHYWQRWYERLPKGLNGGTKKDRIVRALTRAVEHFPVSAGPVDGRE
ncbi:MAG: hypothetical protein AAFU77_04550 [Myxococcota bacterium]